MKEYGKNVCQFLSHIIAIIKCKENDFEFDIQTNKKEIVYSKLNLSKVEEERKSHNRVNGVRYLQLFFNHKEYIYFASNHISCLWQL